MTTFTDAELDQLAAMLVQTDPSKIGFYGPKAYNRDGRAALAAITYLRSQLDGALAMKLLREQALMKERAAMADPIGAAIMRDRAIEVLDDTVTGASVYSWVAIDRASNAIKDLPLPTHAETLAYALELPEVKALVTKCNNMVKGDYPSESLSFMAALKDHVEELEAALAALEPKP